MGHFGLKLWQRLEINSKKFQFSNLSYQTIVGINQFNHDLEIINRLKNDFKKQISFNLAGWTESTLTNKELMFFYYLIFFFQKVFTKFKLTFKLR